MVGSFEQSERSGRIASAFNSEPIASTLRRNGEWKSIYVANVARVENNCAAHNICDHGWDHMNHVSQNVDFLREVVLSSARKRNPNLDQRYDWEKAVPLSSLLYVVFKSDLHYGDDVSGVSDYTFPDHAAQSGRDIEAYAECFPLNEAQSILKKKNAWFKAAVSHTLPSALKVSEELLLSPYCVSPHQLFEIVPKIADVLDLFRSSRLQNVDLDAVFEHEDSSGVRNIYPRLAGSVSAATIVDWGHTLSYDVELEGPLRERVFPEAHTAYRQWYNMSLEEARDRNYAQNWQLLDNFSAILGKDFQVREANSVTQDSLANARNYVRCT